MSQKRIKNHQKTSPKNEPKKRRPNFNQNGPKGDQNTTDKGGEGRDPGWNPSIKKKEYCKKGTRRTLTKANTLRGGQSPARGRISVACGNSSAPGPREDSLHAKICKKFDTRVNAGVFFTNFCLKN